MMDTYKNKDLKNDAVGKFISMNKKKKFELLLDQSFN